jgi:hypothetical protein
VSLAGACAKPEFQYVSQSPGTSGAGQVLFKVPSGWSEFTAQQIDTAESGWGADTTAKNLLAATIWQSAFDGSGTPSLTHVLGTATPSQPTVYASLRTLFQQETPTDDSLRDMLVPVSSFGSEIRIETDEKISKGAAHGVRLVFSYVPAGGQTSETIDQTALLNGAKNAVYLFVVRCSTECFVNNKAAITSVTDSYTIQEGPNG